MLIAAISYVGYVAVRVLGPTRGLLVSALTGALFSSTAVTVALARVAVDASGVSTFAGAAALAATVSIVRVMVIVLILEPAVAVGASGARRRSGVYSRRAVPSVARR